MCAGADVTLAVSGGFRLAPSGTLAVTLPLPMSTTTYSETDHSSNETRYNGSVHASKGQAYSESVQASTYSETVHTSKEPSSYAERGHYGSARNRCSETLHQSGLRPPPLVIESGKGNR